VSTDSRSYIADSSLGWRWIGWLGAIFNGGTFVIFLFGLEETAFRRDLYLINNGDRYLVDGVSATDGADSETRSGLAGNKAEEEKIEPKRNASANLEQQPIASQEKRKTYWQQIAIITPAANLRGMGFKQYYQRLFHTLRVFTFPAVIYSGVQ
jgi:hypothetical protein